MNTTVIGTGGWGTALAVLLHGNGHRVALWGRMSEEVEPIWAARENKAFLPGVKIPEAIRVTLDENEALRDAELVVLAVPSHGMRTICGKIRNHIPSAATLVSVAKGIETETGARMSRVIGDALTTTLVRETDAVRDTETRAAYNASHPVLDRLVVLSGPSHAEEVGRGIPTAVVVASMNPTAATKAQQAFMNERFRVYTHDDVIGVELGGALKNIIALAAGVCDGIGFGDNSKAAVCTRGLAEMARLGVALDARRETFFGLSGVGDLMVTAFSHHSRNRRFGERLGKDETPEQITSSTQMVAEGVRTARAVHQLAKRLNVSAPITAEVCAIIYEGKSPRAAVRDLMTREAKAENG